MSILLTLIAALQASTAGTALPQLCTQAECLVPPSLADTPEQIAKRREDQIVLERTILAPLAGGITASNCAEAIGLAKAKGHPALPYIIEKTCSQKAGETNS